MMCNKHREIFCLFLFTNIVIWYYLISLAIWIGKEVVNKKIVKIFDECHIMVKLTYLTLITFLKEEPFWKALNICKPLITWTSFNSQITSSWNVLVIIGYAVANSILKAYPPWETSFKPSSGVIKYSLPLCPFSL